MGYFPNGTSFAHWQDEHCSDCLNYRDNGSGSYGCPITDAHFTFDYVRGGTPAAILDSFIPDDGVDAFKCRMRVTHDILANEQAARDGQADLERYLAALSESKAAGLDPVERLSIPARETVL